MKTLEDIMRDVTPPETWTHSANLKVLNGPQGVLAGFYGNAGWEDSVFALRAARNFVPLVMALQDMLEVAWPNESQPDSRTNKAIDAAKSVLNQALADEP